MSRLSIRNLRVEARGRPLVADASLTLGAGELLALVGPNGAGKTTLLRAALGLIRRSAGESLLDGRDTLRLEPRERARRVAYLPQQRPMAWPSRVRDVVAMGRFAFGATPARLGPKDAEATAKALRSAGLERLADRSADALSGGELARMHVARALAAEAPLLVADEPTAALDLLHQLQVMELIRRFVDGGGGALIVLHDLETAARYTDRLIWMRGGRIVGDGPPKETLTSERLAEVHEVRAEVLWSKGAARVTILGPAEQPDRP